MTLPPGRVRLATRPLPTGSPAVANTIGITDVACLAAMTVGVLWVTMTSDFQADELSRNLGEAVAAPLCPTVFDRDIATLQPAKLAKSLHKRADPLGCDRTRRRAHEPDGGVACLPAARVPPPARRRRRREA